MALDLQSPDARLLEGLIDRYRLGVIVDALAAICHEKGIHIRDNWQDRPLAQTWHRDGNKLERISPTLENR